MQPPPRSMDAFCAWWAEEKKRHPCRPRNPLTMHPVAAQGPTSRMLDDLCRRMEEGQISQTAFDRMKAAACNVKETTASTASSVSASTRRIAPAAPVRAPSPRVSPPAKRSPPQHSSVRPQSARRQSSATSAAAATGTKRERQHQKQHQTVLVLPPGAGWPGATALYPGAQYPHYPSFPTPQNAFGRGLKAVHDNVRQVELVARATSDMVNAAQPLAPLVGNVVDAARPLARSARNAATAAAGAVGRTVGFRGSTAADV
jgi:hypothetical protein